MVRKSDWFGDLYYISKRRMVIAKSCVLVSLERLAHISFGSSRHEVSLPSLETCCSEVSHR